MKHTAIFATLGLLSAAAFVAHADETPLYTTTAFGFSVSEITGVPVSVTSLDAKSLSCLVGESVSSTAPDGTVAALAAVDGVCTWTPTAGGTWTFCNSLEGDAVFTVRYSLFPGTQGTGTVADPFKIVDDTELADMFAGGVLSEGGAFSLRGPYGIGSLAIPAGYAVDGAGDGVYRLVAASGGFLYGSLPSVCIVDSAKPGPNRSVKDASHMPPFAYSGDGWLGSDTAASTLSFLSPSGTSATEGPFEGWGTFGYALPKRGVWTVTLTMADGTTLESEIKYMAGLAIVIR